MEKKDRCGVQTDLDKRLNQWLSSPPGTLLLEQETNSLESVLSGIFGHFLVQVGFPGLDTSPVGCNTVKFRLMAVPRHPDNPRSDWICADPSRLPIATDSIDVLLLQHTLDFYPDPHQVLREADRILIPEGRLVVVGFNPWSLWGLWRIFRKRSNRLPWCGRFLSPGRVNDWLSLLGFKVETTEFLMFRPPLRHNALMSRLNVMERLGSHYWPIMSGVYLMVAVKRVMTLTPVKPAWKLPSGILGGRAIEPTARNGRG